MSAVADTAEGNCRLAGAIEKFNRSKEVFDQLRREMNAFFNGDPRPYFSEGRIEENGRDWVEIFRVRAAPPDRFGVLLGDCVHNLRSCLDHMVWQTVLLDGGSPGSSTQYPIASESRKQFDRMARSRLAGMSLDHVALIEKTQPYHSAQNARGHPLAVLADLSNTDKHRVLNTAFSFMAEEADEILDGLWAPGEYWATCAG